MSPERWRQIEQLYHTAVEYNTPERTLFLEKACAGDDALRREIESLLVFDKADERFLEPLPAGIAAEILANDQAQEPASERPAAQGAAAHPMPSAIGGYRILRLLGVGGMGAVYEAEQQTPHRRVALKIIRPGLATDQLLRRFEQEANALGRLQHPGIAQIYEAGAADAGFGPQPYFAMEFIQGRSLLQHAEQHHLNMRQRLELTAKICEAIHHAHQRGIIHRDLKPGNILVDETGQPKILDFGVARVTDAETQVTRQTDVGQLLGTLAYMSPEQVAGNPLDVDTRSDVYALGVILYELLAGRPPYQLGPRLPEAVRIIQEEDPAPLSSMSRYYRGDIETIVAKALEKDKSRRYASAADLAADIRRYLADEPITARPPTAGYHLQKFARRHKGLVLSVAAVFAVLVTGAIASTAEAMRASRAGKAAAVQRDRATAAERAATAERDRALSAESVASTERNRALLEARRADTESAIAKAVNDFLQNDLLAQAGARSQARLSAKPDPDLKVRTALDRAAASIGDRFKTQPLVEAAIRQTIGDAYQELGLYPEAERHAARSLELRRYFLGDQHPDTLFSMNRLGEQDLAEGKYDQAEAIFRPVLEARRRILGIDHVDTLTSMTDLAAVYRLKGRYPDAERMDTEVLHRELRVLGSKRVETLDTMSNLAQLYVHENKYREAEALYGRLLRLDSRVLGDDDPLRLTAMSSLGQIYRRQGKYQAAEPLYMKSLEVLRRVLGEEHADTLTAMSNLADLYRAQNQYLQAEVMYSQILETCRRALGEEHPTTLASMGSLANVYRDQGKYQQAEALYVKVLAVRQRLLGRQNPATVTVLGNLGVLYRDQGKYDQAERSMTEVVEVWRRIHGEEHPNTLQHMGNLAIIYRDEGKYGEAERILTHTSEIWHRRAGPDDPETLRSLNNLAAVYRCQGKYAQAEPLLLQALEDRQRLLGSEHRDTLTSMSDLALLYNAKNRYDKAEPLITSVITMRQHLLGAGHPDTVSAVVLLSQIRIQQKRYAETETLLRGTVTDAEKTIPDSWLRYCSQSLLGMSLVGQGRHAEGEPILLSGYHGMLERRTTIPADSQPLLRQIESWVVQIHPDGGQLSVIANFVYPSFIRSVSTRCRRGFRPPVAFWVVSLSRRRFKVPDYDIPNLTLYCKT